MKKFLILSMLIMIGNSSFAETWVNDMRTLFSDNQAVIMTINMRTFNAKDLNGNGIIEPKYGENKGNFVNAIERLDELEKLGINTVHLLPITPVGTRKAFGTAGSLYATSSFNSLNPQLRSDDSILNVKLQAKDFVDACHKRNIRVIVEVPSCASYDLYLKKSQLFVKDKNRNTIIPSDWTDVRLLKAGTEFNINNDIYALYRDFLDMVLALNVDGVVVSEPSLKPAAFWAKLITYARSQNPQFLFLAEMKPSQKKSIVKQIPFVNLEKLLNIGFDGFYGDFNKVSEWCTASDLLAQINLNTKIVKKFSTKKNVVGSFVTHNDISPILVKGAYLSKMIIWLNSTLPVNPIYVDGFQTGDDYGYEWANLRANTSETDDNIYFVHRGKLDIFNFSRRPGGVRSDIKEDFYSANKFKQYMRDYLPDAEFVVLKSPLPEVFAYAMTDKKTKNTVVVIGNLDNENIKELKIKIPRLSGRAQPVLVKSIAMPQIKRGSLSTVIAPGDVQVILLKNFALK